MARTCHCTEGCSAAKFASLGASHSEATDPLAEMASIGRAPRARSRTASQAVASCANVASTARSNASPSAVTAVRVWPAPLRARVSSRRAKRRLEAADLMAHRGGADVQRQRGPRERAVARDRGEGPQRRQRGNPIGHRRSI